MGKSGQNNQLKKESDHFKALEDKIKFYVTEIITLKSMNKAQDRVIAKLREENIRLKKENEHLRMEGILPKN